MSNRLVVIGLDGAEWELIKLGIERDKLPAFKRITSDGTFGLLRSTIPHITPPAWTSAFTGVNPGKHNIIGFLTSEGYSPRLVNSTDRKSRAIWNILSEKGLHVIVVNVPVTFPPEEVNGIMVSGIPMARGTSMEYTYPASLRKELDQIGYIVDVFPPFSKENIQHVFNTIEKRKQAALHLSKNNMWDLLIVVFSVLDRVQHYFWEQLNDPEERSPFGNVVLRTYEALDNAIEEMLSTYQGENFIFFSDHGFGPLEGVTLNSWFENHGLTKKVKQHKSRAFKSLAPLKLRYASGKITRFLPKRIKTRLSQTRRARLSPRIVAEPEPFSQSTSVDWHNSKVNVVAGQVTINLRGRQPSGIVESGEEYESLRNFIIKNLPSFQDSNRTVVQQVHRREELYHGPYVNNLPDLIVEPKPGFYFLPGQPSKKKLSAGHRLFGVFIAYGPEIRKGFNIEDAKITDIAPTILHLLHMQIPQHMDGKVLLDIFKRDSESFAKEVQYTARGEDTEKHKTREVFTKKEENEIKKKLERLGYF